MYYHDYSIVLFCYNSYITHISSQCTLYRSCHSGHTTYRGLFTVVLLQSLITMALLQSLTTRVLLQSLITTDLLHKSHQWLCYTSLVTAVLLQWSCHCYRGLITMVWSVTQFSSVVLLHMFCVIILLHVLLKHCYTI